MNKEKWMDLQDDLELFLDFDINICYLFMTKTAFEKSIIDATIPVTNFLKKNQLHDFSNQQQGIEYKKLIKSNIILDNEIIDFNTSLYRPTTKNGDNRLWFNDLKRKLNLDQFGPDNYIAMTTFENELYIINLNDESVLESLLNKNFVYKILDDISKKQHAVAKELLEKLKKISDEGFIPTIRNGDTGIGMTLENKLGIAPNSSRKPDYKGIEIKSYRVGENTVKNRSNLFSKVPDWKNSEFHSSKELLDEFGYYDEKRDRISLNCTIKSYESNSQGLYLNIDKNRNKLEVLHEEKNKVVEWDLETLHDSLLKKHHETFWVEAESKKINGIEHFKYTKITHTRDPQISLFDLLIDTQIITLDFVMHIRENGSARDHGYLFKIKEDNLNKLFPKIEKYTLSTL